jgi:hypothetical protein
MNYGARKSDRVDFERGIPVFMMGIDGTWRRDCLMVDVSQTGARLLIESSLEGLDLKEFFLLLSSTGLAYRRCQLVRVDGNQIGIEFLARGKSAKKARQRSHDQAD